MVAPRHGKRTHGCKYCVLCRGPLLPKTVILVTNALQYLPLADNILWMENGTIRAQGKYAALVEAGEQGFWGTFILAAVGLC